MSRPKTAARWLALASLLVAALATPTARATTDGGWSARILAVAEDGSRAVVVDANIQAPCGAERCRVYAVDLTAPGVRRTHRLELAANPTGRELSDEETLEAYLGDLGADAAELGPLRPRSMLSLLRVAEADEERTVLVQAPSGPVAVRLRVVRELDSMAPYDALGNEPCDPAGYQAPPACSTCTEVEHRVDGALQAGWVCRGRGTRLVGGATVPCDCDAPGRVVTVAIDGGLPGSEVLLEPYRLGQNVMNGPGVPPSLEVSWAHQDVEAIETRQGSLLVAGSIVHARMANGTFLPVLAVRPANLPVAVTEPPKTHDAGPDLSVQVLPSPPVAPRCGACRVGAAGAASDAAGSGALLALALWRRRRRPSVRRDGGGAAPSLRRRAS